jgi:hypothetical protein
MRKLIAAILCAGLVLGTTAACSSDADVASENLSKDADNFKILRRIVFYNGITNTYILVIEGYCSIGNNDKPGEVTITCKVGKDQFKKHFLGRSDNVTYFAEQIDAANVSVDHYKVIFKPESIVPDVEKR